MLNLYVSSAGRDTWSGRLPAPTAALTNGPFATLEGARDAIRRLRADGLPADTPITVWLLGGTYSRGATFELGPKDGGTAKAPVTYAAYHGETVRLVGGEDVDGFQPVTDPATVARLDPAARGHVLQVNLRERGITNYGEMRRKGFGVASSPAWLEVFYQDKPMELARWPNVGQWATIAGVPNGQNGGRFTYEGDRPRRWANLDDVWVHGYWTYDWADTYEKVASIDVDKREVATVPPHGQYGYTAGKRFYFLNVLEELDSPGEWYLDRKAGILYFWPPDSAQHPKVTVSMLESPLIVLNGASHVVLRGLTLEASRGSGVEIRGGTGNLVSSCTIRNLGTNGVTIDGGSANGVDHCELYGLGETAISFSGGDRRTLTPGNHFATNNHIHHYSRICFTYRPAVAVNGVGNRIAHNLIHDAPHNAILLGGNDHMIEYNDISRVCLQTGDAGAIYMGRDMTMRGNVIRYNYLHDIQPAVRNVPGFFTDVMAVYLDDCFCGTTVYGNVFFRAGRAAMIGGGRDNTIENNIFVDCNPAIHVDARGRGWASFWFNGKDSTIMDRLKEVPYNQPPYSTRYPHLANLLDDDPAEAKYNRIVRNVWFGGRWIEMQDGLTDKVVTFEANLLGEDPGFVGAKLPLAKDAPSPAATAFQLKPGSPALKLGFKQLPLGQIGIRRAR